MYVSLCINMYVCFSHVQVSFVLYMSIQFINPCTYINTSLYIHMYIMHLYILKHICIYPYCYIHRSSSARSLPPPTLQSAAFASVQFRVKKETKHKRGRTKKARPRNQIFNVTFELSGCSLCATVSRYLWHGESVSVT